MKLRHKIISFGLLFFFILGGITALPSPSQAKAKFIGTKVSLGKKEVKWGKTISHRNGNLLFAVWPKQLKQKATLTIQTVKLGNIALPDGQQAISRMYKYSVKGKIKNPVSMTRPFSVAIRYRTNNDREKSIYFWDEGKKTWEKISSNNDDQAHIIRGQLERVSGSIMVLEETAPTYEGIASWYDEKTDHGAACNIFPMGTRLLVTDLETGKSTEVTIVSTGPFVPGRIVDLDKKSFEDLAPLSRGLIHVKIEPTTGSYIKKAEEPKIDALSAIVIDEKTGQALWQKNADDPRPLASISKLMTAVIFLETKTPLDKVITYENSDNAEGAKLYVSAGETMTARDLFYTMLVGSANNATMALVHSTGLTEEEFVSKMNEKAAAWGLSKTHFEEPTGLSKDNVSSAHDIALLAKKALAKNEIFYASITPYYDFSTINTKNAHQIKNTNKLLFENTDFRLTGGKTGYIDESGYCLVSRGQNSDGSKSVVAVVLGLEHESWRFDEVEQLINWGLGK